MEYFIKDISTCKPVCGAKYFVDANIWLPYFQSICNKSHDKKYADFLDSIIDFVDTPKPKIIVTGALLSEVINRCLRDLGMKLYAKHNNYDPQNLEKTFYKSVYRKSKQFSIDYAQYCNNFKQILGSLEFAKDGIDRFKAKEILTAKKLNLDFNDNMYCLLAERDKFTIVTHDGDFWVKNINIYTANTTLLAEQSQINTAYNSSKSETILTK